MGRYTEKLRAIVAEIRDINPRALSPEIFAQLANGAMRCIAQLEEQNEDQEKEIHRLQEQLMEAGIAGEGWKP